MADAGAHEGSLHDSFFWSVEFWGAIMSNNGPSRHGNGRLLIMLLLLSGIMSLLVGPVTAVLMIPRILDWPVGGGVFWLNGT